MIADHLDLMQLTPEIIFIDFLLAPGLIVWAILSQKRLPLFMVIAYEVLGIAMNALSLSDIDPTQATGVWMHIAIRATAIALLATSLTMKEPARRPVSAAAR